MLEIKLVAIFQCIVVIVFVLVSVFVLFFGSSRVRVLRSTLAWVVPFTFRSWVKKLALARRQGRTDSRCIFLRQIWAVIEKYRLPR